MYRDGTILKIKQQRGRQQRIKNLRFPSSIFIIPVLIVLRFWEQIYGKEILEILFFEEKKTWEHRSLRIKSPEPLLT
jgi:hypothetical protein